MLRGGTGISSSYPLLTSQWFTTFRLASAPPINITPHSAPPINNQLWKLPPTLARHPWILGCNWAIFSPLNHVRFPPLIQILLYSILVRKLGGGGGGLGGSFCSALRWKQNRSRRLYCRHLSRSLLYKWLGVDGVTSSPFPTPHPISQLICNTVVHFKTT